MAVCSMCNGLMKVQCPKCGGTGCPNCNGSGQVKCPRCNGTGREPGT